MVTVSLWSGLAPLADNQRTIKVDAGDIRQLLRKLAEMYPGLKEPIKNQVAVAIDGVVYRDDWSKKISADTEVFLIRRVPGG